MVPRKRRPDEIQDLREPPLSEVQREFLAEGIALFNAGKYWHAHEAWELLWREMSNDPEDDAEIVVRGLIQLTAGLHLLGIDRLEGAGSNFRKSYQKLSLAPSRFLGIEIEPLRRYLRSWIAGIDPGERPIIEPAP
jgi:predicted metal-dependent hydrolase